MRPVWVATPQARRLVAAARDERGEDDDRQDGLRWTSGADELADMDGLCWTCEGSATEDSLHIFNFQWTDPAPAQPDFERLMHRAAVAIDEWISGQM